MEAGLELFREPECEDIIVVGSSEGSRKVDGRAEGGGDDRGWWCCDGETDEASGTGSGESTSAIAKAGGPAITLPLQPPGIQNSRAKERPEEHGGYPSFAAPSRLRKRAPTRLRPAAL